MKATRTTFWLTTLVSLLLAGNAFAATFVVDSLSSEAEPAPGDGVCQTPSGVCTLTAAIQEAEAGLGTFDVIDLTGVSGKITVGSVTFAQSVELRGAGITLEGTSENYRWRGDDTTISGIEFVGFRNLIMEGDNQTFAGNTVRDGAGVSSTGANNAFLGNQVFATTSFAAIDMRGNDNGVVDGNIIGFDESSSPAPGASQAGLSVSKSTNVSVTSNTSHGFVAGFFLSAVTNSTFYKNRIGDFDGATGNGAAYHGIWSATGTDNVFDANSTNGNTQNGIYFNGCVAALVTGHVAHLNGDAGIKIEANANVDVMNSSLEGNATGITAFGNNSVFRSNRITQNAGIGIDLANDGVTANDDLDGFTNFPSLTTATGGASFAVDGAFADAAAANSNVDIDFFASDGCDASGNGEGATSVGSITVTTDAAGDGAFSASFATPVAPGKFVTATATGPEGTSEFSACVEVIPGAQEANVDFYKLNHWVFHKRSWKPLVGLFLGSDDVDVDDISLTSLRLGTAPAVVAIYGDINRDGHKDLIIGFIGRFTGATCGTTELELTGEIGSATFSEILGVRIVGCNGHGHHGDDDDDDDDD